MREAREMRLFDYVGGISSCDSVGGVERVS